MRVLKGRVLVAGQATSADSLVGDVISRRGFVEVSGSGEVEKGDDILFGEAFEEITVEVKSMKRYYLMKEENIKIIYDGDGPKPAKDNVLPFFKEMANG